MPAKRPSKAIRWPWLIERQRRRIAHCARYAFGLADRVEETARKLR
jgi:hypothetical protein